MKIKFFLLVFTLVLLGACSNPTAYQVNPKPDEPTKQQEVPESQQEDYMRILGDLRWDNISSPKDLEKAFPGCLRASDERPGSIMTLEQDLQYIYRAHSREKHVVNNMPDCRKAVGGITFTLQGANFEPDSSGRLKQRLSKIVFYVFKEDQYRAFKEVLKSKMTDETYETVMGTREKYCSPYTCWGEWFFASSEAFQLTPTPKTTSILDNVSVNPNAF